MKTYKRYFIFLGILIILSPLGVILPGVFKAGGAWGEWSLKTVKEQTGREPAGMKKNAAIYKAPVSDYTLGKKEDSLSKQSVNYIISGLIGTGLILVLTFGAVKIISRKQTL